MLKESSSKTLFITGLILAVSLGFFTGALLFNQKFPLFENREGVSDGQKMHQKDFEEIRKQQRKLSKEEIDSALGLSKEQIAKLDSNIKTCDSTRKYIREKIRVAENNLHNILNQNPIPEAELKVIRAELLNLDEIRLDSRINDIKLFKSVLTKEQNDKLKLLQPRLENKTHDKKNFHFKHIHQSKMKE